MKNTIVITLIALSVLALTTPSFGARYNKAGSFSSITVEGKVLTVNSAKGWFDIQDKDNGTRITGYGFAKDIATLNEGDYVQVTLSQPGHFLQKIQR